MSFVGFLVVDADGTVLLPLGGHSVGDRLPAQRLARGGRLTAPIREITTAVRAMRRGELRPADIDHFKRINDRFSHAACDAVLRAVAESIRSHIRESDFVARYGGEEFAILFPETPLPVALALAERVRNLIRDRDWSMINPDLQVSISFGLCGDTDLSSLEEMINMADEKLYEARRAGRDRACH